MSFFTFPYGALTVRVRIGHQIAGLFHHVHTFFFIDDFASEFPICAIYINVGVTPFFLVARRDLSTDPAGSIYVRKNEKGNKK